MTEFGIYGLENLIAYFSEFTVNESNIEKPIAISHAILIPEKMVWIEGIRVDPKYRFQKLATNMSLHILDYARKKWLSTSSSAIVSIDNDASKGLMEKLGFKMISKWTYISIKPIVLPDLSCNCILLQGCQIK